MEGETGKDETTDNTCDKKDQDKVEVHVVKVNSAENDTVCTKGVVNTNVKYESVSTGKSPELWSPTSALKKDFRIIGQGGNKDKLAFLGRCRQIDEGLFKGYTEREVISGILNAISPASGLSGYLNTVKDLGLVQFKSILHTWLNGKSSSELYQNLSVMYQLPNDTPQEFLVRALECREKQLSCAVKKINRV